MQLGPLIPQVLFYRVSDIHMEVGNYMAAERCYHFRGTRISEIQKGPILGGLFESEEAFSIVEKVKVSKDKVANHLKLKG